jgi:hypothetical protein
MEVEGLFRESQTDRNDTLCNNKHTISSMK